MSKQGRLIGLALALAALAGCASDGYVYHEDGYWTGPTPARAVVVYDASSACAPWYDPFGYGGVHAWYPCSGFGPGPYLGYGYYGYYDPYWAYRVPRPSLGERRDAREQGRWMMQRERPDLAQFPRYDELAPQRRRDIGGGDRAWPSAGFGSYPDTRASRAGIGSSARGSSGLSAASGRPLSRGASAPAPRAREVQNEE